MCIELKQVHLAYEDAVVLDQFSLRLPEQGFVSFLGPSGCGKTTLLSLLAGLLMPQKGTISGLAGKQISMIFQEDRLLPWCSAQENVTLPCKDAAKGQAMLEALALNAVGHKKPAELSGGMNRRVAIARALAYGGDVFLMDEPLKGLDASLKAEVMEQIHHFTKGALVLMVTHDLDEVLAMADTVYQFAGTPLRLLQKTDIFVDYNERKNNMFFYEEYKRKLLSQSLAGNVDSDPIS